MQIQEGDRDMKNLEGDRNKKTQEKVKDSDTLQLSQKRKRWKSAPHQYLDETRIEEH